MTRLATLARLLALGMMAGLLALPTLASADQEHCAGSACVRTVSGESGSGACGQPAADYSLYRAYYVDYADGATTHRVFVENFCYAMGWEGYSEYGSGLGAGYQRTNSDTGDFGIARAGWNGFAWSSGAGGGEDCALYLFVYNVPPLPEENQREDCPAGQMPPVVLPPL